MAIFDATYVSADSFTIAGNVEQYFPAGVIVRVDCGGWVYSPVESSVYSSPNTTITLEDSVLTSPCGYAEVSTCSPDGVPIHTHSDNASGGSSVAGTAPAHEWLGSSIRFRDPDGDWGAWVNLGGLASDTVEGTAGEDLDQYEGVYLDSSDGKWYLASASFSKSAPFGIVIESGGISNGNTGTICVFGLVANTSWTWTPGARLYLTTTDGILSETAIEGFDVGCAVTATSALIFSRTIAGYPAYTILYGRAGEALNQYDIVYPVGNIEGVNWFKACAGDEATKNGIGIVVQSGGIAYGNYGDISLFGFVAIPGAGGGSYVGVPIFLSDTTPGEFVYEEPTNYVIPLGWALTDSIIFSPSYGDFSAGGGGGGGRSDNWTPLPFEPLPGSETEDYIASLFVPAGTYYPVGYWFDGVFSERDTTQDPFVIDEDSEVTNLDVEYGEHSNSWNYAWTTSHSYASDAWVINDGNFYRARIVHTSATENEPGAGEDWEMYWEQQYAIDPYEGVWTISTSYDLGGYVTHVYGGYTSVWYCIQSHTSTADDEPFIGANYDDYWELLQYQSWFQETWNTSGILGGKVNSSWYSVWMVGTNLGEGGLLLLPFIRLYDVSYSPKRYSPGDHDTGLVYEDGFITANNQFNNYWIVSIQKGSSEFGNKSIINDTYETTSDYFTIDGDPGYSAGEWLMIVPPAFELDGEENPYYFRHVFLGAVRIDEDGRFVYSHRESFQKYILPNRPSINGYKGTTQGVSTLTCVSPLASRAIVQINLAETTSNRGYIYRIFERSGTAVWKTGNIKFGTDVDVLEYKEDVSIPLFNPQIINNYMAYYNTSGAETAITGGGTAEFIVEGWEEGPVMWETLS